MEKKLPIHEALDDIETAIESHDEVILQAPPGAGKTTVVPLKFLGHPLFDNLKILMLEPRRIAARNAAARMASMIGEDVGDTIGYRMRLDTKVSRDTKIEVVTDSILIRMLQTDPALSDVGMVIFDEFHERGLDSDLGLSLCLKSNELFRQTPLKLLFMSATLEDDKLSGFLDQAPVVRSLGKAFPVDISYLGAAKPKERIGERVVQSLLPLMARFPDDSMLVFLPGEGEIRFVESGLKLRLQQQSPTAQAATNTIISPLYGNLTLDAQSQAIAPAPVGKRKIVLATNIAETSLTIEGVTVVLDSGLERQARFDPNTGMSRLVTQRISQASAIQRAGRAGRTAPGHCFRLWSEQQQTQLAAQSSPEILLADLSSLALQIYSWGLDQVSDLRWLDAPPKGAWSQANEQLVEFSAIEHKGSATLLTQHGERMASLALPPRIAHMLIHASRIGEPQLGCVLAAMLTEREPRVGSQHSEANLLDRLSIALGQAPCPDPYRSWFYRVGNLSAQYRKSLAKLNLDQTEIIDNFEQRVAVLIAFAYPDRIARKRHAGGYQLANGRSASLAAKDSMKKQKWLAIADISGKKGTSDLIRSAVTLDPTLFDSVLSSLKHREQHLDWDKQTSRFIAEQRTRVGALIIERTKLDNIPERDKVDAICEYIRSQGLALFSKQPELETLQKRCRLMFALNPTVDFELTDEHLLADLERWLGPYLSGITKLEQLTKLDSIESFLINCRSSNNSNSTNRSRPILPCQLDHDSRSITVNPTLCYRSNFRKCSVRQHTNHRIGSNPANGSFAFASRPALANHPRSCRFLAHQLPRGEKRNAWSISQTSLAGRPNQGFAD